MVTTAMVGIERVLEVARVPVEASLKAARGPGQGGGLQGMGVWQQQGSRGSCGMKPSSLPMVIASRAKGPYILQQAKPDPAPPASSSRLDGEALQARSSL